MLPCIYSLGQILILTIYFVVCANRVAIVGNSDRETFVCIAFICQVFYHYSSLLMPRWSEIESYYLLMIRDRCRLVGWQRLRLRQNPYGNILFSVSRSSARFISYANGSGGCFACATFTNNEAASDVVPLFARIVFVNAIGRLGV